MRAGGNAYLQRALADAGVPTDTPIAQKYNSNVASAYRTRITALAKKGLDGSFAPGTDESADASAGGNAVAGAATAARTADSELVTSADKTHCADEDDDWDTWDE